MVNVKENLIGQKFGRLTVIGRDEDHIYPSGKRRARWICQCSCKDHNIVSVLQTGLKNGHNNSCGCLRKENTSKMFKKTGNSETRLYYIWCSMKARCENPNNISYKNYGGRGIKVCSEWHDYSNFEKWALTNNYQDGLSIERKNVNDNYCPENCTWITLKEQCWNKQNTIYVNYNGEKIKLHDLCEKFDADYTLVKSRIKNYGFTVKEALTLPLYYKRKYCGEKEDING